MQSRKLGIAILILIGLITASFVIAEMKDGLNAGNADAASLGAGNTLYVGGSGANNYTKIQDAINDANDGDTIFVYSGTYYENVVINKTINLIGENKNTTIIDGGGVGDVIYIMADGVNISTLSLRNGGFGENLASLKVNSSSNVNISNCNITDSYYGIIISNSLKIKITQCKIQNHWFITEIYNSSVTTIENCYLKKSMNYGILLKESKDNIISNSEIQFCIDGIIIENSLNNSITTCRILNNCIGVRLSASSKNIIKSCNVTNNGKAIESYSSNYNEIISSIISNNVYGVVLFRNSNGNLIFKNLFFNNSNQNVEDKCQNLWNSTNIGNFWDDYKLRYPNASILNGFWSRPYKIFGGNNQDSYPMVLPPNITRVPPFAHFSLSNKYPVLSETVIFNASSSYSIEGSNIISYHWDFGDGHESEGKVVSHSYSHTQKYNVKLIITDDYGLSAETSINIFVIPFPLQKNWPIEGDVTEESLLCPLVADLNNDGYMELIGGKKVTNKGIYVVDHNGSILHGWPVQIGLQYKSKIAVGDLNNDNMLEIIAVDHYDNEIFVLNYDGTYYKNFPIYINSTYQISRTPMISDLNGDGKDEIIISSANGIYVILENGSYMKGFPAFTDMNFGNSNPSVADIDENGDLEIVASSSDGMVYAMHHDGNLVDGWPVKVEGMGGGIAIGDIDKNYWGLEVIVGSAYCDAKIYAFHYDGSPVNGWPVCTAIPNHFSKHPSLGDLDRDNNIEILAGTYDAAQNKIHAWHNNGIPVDGWPVNVSWSVTTEPVLADIDNDMDIEVIAETEDYMYIWGSNGTLEYKWCEPRGGILTLTSPAISDIDKDGDIEIIADVFNAVYDLPYKYNSRTVEWGECRYDYSNHGSYLNKEKAIINLEIGNQEIDAVEKANISAMINTTQNTTIKIIPYEGLPTEETHIVKLVRKYIEVDVKNENALQWPIYIQIYYNQQDLENAGLIEDQLLGVYFYNETSKKWQLYDDTGVNTTNVVVNGKEYAGYAWANVNHLTKMTIGANIPSNQPPIVGLTFPTRGTTASGTISIAGTANDTDGNVQLVQVKIDSGLWINATGTTSWSYSWDTTTVANGSHTIYARSYDGTNYSNISSVTVTVNNIPPNQPPTVAITSPLNGSTVSGTVTIAGTASDDVSVEKVEIKIDDDSWQEATGTTSWTYSWDTTSMATGNYDIYARSYDGTDYSSILSVKVTVNNIPPNHKPTVEIIFPNNGTEVKKTIIIHGTASDEDGNETIQKVEIKIGDGDWKVVNGTTSWNYTWDSTTVDNGDHVIQARAYDGQEYSSIDSIMVKVNNEKGGGGGIPGFEMVALIAVLGAVVLVERKRK